MVMDYSIHKGSFLNFIVPNIFKKKIRLFFIQLFFIYEVGKRPKHIRCCAIAEILLAVSQKYQNFKKSETATLSQLVLLWKVF